MSGVFVVVSPFNRELILLVLDWRDWAFLPSPVTRVAATACRSLGVCTQSRPLLVSHAGSLHRNFNKLSEQRSLTPDGPPWTASTLSSELCRVHFPTSCPLWRAKASISPSDPGSPLQLDYFSSKADLLSRALVCVGAFVTSVFNVL